jgi:predicted ATPase/DNA-binding SARP family transcriptional activator
LTVLIVNYPNVVSIDRIIDDLWHDDIPATAQGTVYSYVSRLRSALGSEAIAKEGDGYRLVLPSGALDVVRFEATLERASQHRRNGELDEAIAEYASAIELWRGDPFGDLAYEPFLAPERTRLSELHAAAVEGLVIARVDIDATAPDLIAEIESAIAAFPLRENLWEALMRALYRQGRQADALRAYRRATRTLGEELGIEPGPELAALEQQILLQHPGLDERLDQEDRRTGSGIATNLRETTGSFVGRNEQRTSLVAALDSHRVVTLVGPGGVGKTRLAVEVCWEVAAGKPGGIWDIDLLPETGAGRITSLLSEVLGIPPQSGVDPVDAIARRLEGTPALILIDNCEHLVEVGPTIDELISAVPDVSVIATSQQPTGAAGEHVIEIPTLATASADATPDRVMAVAAAELFEDRVRLVKPGYRSFGVDAEAVGQIVRHLDGLPLAIEIAAAQAAMYTVKEIAEHVMANATGAMASPSDDPRHQTLTALVEWSFAQLEGDDRSRMAELCVFAGPLDVDAAAHIWSASDRSHAAAALERLRTRSLLQVVPGGGSETRYRVLESVRTYGRSRLQGGGRWEDTISRHVRWVGELASDAARHFHDRTQSQWFTRLREVRAEIDQALATSHAEPKEFTQLVTSLWYWYYVGGDFESALVLVDRALEVEETPILLAAKALLLTGETSFSPEEVTKASRRAVQLAGRSNGPEAAHTLVVAGDALTGVGSYEEAEAPLVEAEQRFRQLDIPWGIGWALMRRVRVAALGRGRIDEGHVLHLEAIPYLEKAGDTTLLAYSDIILASRDRLHGRFGESREHALRAIKAYEELGPSYDALEATFWAVNAAIHLNMTSDAELGTTELRSMSQRYGEPAVEFADRLEGRLAIRTGDSDKALGIFRGLLPTLEATGGGYAEVLCHINLAEAFLQAQDPAAAADSCERAQRLVADLEAPFPPAQLAVLRAEIALLLDRLAEAHELVTAAIDNNRSLMQYHWLARAYEAAAEMHRLRSAAGLAADFLARGTTIRDALGAPPRPDRSDHIRRIRRWIEAALPADELEARWAAGAESGLADLVEYEI